MAFLAPLIGGATSLIGGFIGSSAAKKAAAQEAAAAAQAGQGVTDAVRAGQEDVGTNVKNAQDWTGGAVQDANRVVGENASKIIQNLSPYTTAGDTSVGQLQQLAGAGGPLAKQFSFNPTDLASDPGYAFTLKQGQDAIQKAAASQGGLFSTGTLKSLAGYTTGSANQYFGDAYNRALSTFNTNRQGALSQAGILQGLSGQGLSALGSGNTALQTAGLRQGENITEGAQLAGQEGIQGAQFGANLGLQGAKDIGGFLTNKGNAQAAGTAGSTGSWLSALGSGTNALTNYLYSKNNGGGSGGGSSSGSGRSPSSAVQGYGPQLPVPPELIAAMAGG